MSEEGCLFDNSMSDTDVLIRYFDENCSNSYQLPDRIKSIRRGAFRDANIKKLDLNKVTHAETGAIGCPNLEELIIREAIYGINDSILRGSAKIKYLYLPKGTVLTEFTPLTFDSLEIVVMDEGVEMDDVKGIFDSDKNLKTVILPENLSVLPNEIFWGCRSLEKIYIPQSVSKVGWDCFYGLAVSD